MTDYVPIQNGPLAQTELQSDDTLYVADGIIVTSPNNVGGAAVYTAIGATNVHFTVDGTVVGSGGMGVGGASCSLYVGSGGTVRGGHVGVYSGYAAIGGTLYNDGRILSDSIGVEGQSNSHLGAIYNSGLIQVGAGKSDGTNAAIFNYAGTTGTQLIDNSGTIKTLLANSYAFLSQSAVAETVKNSGTMIGKVDLGDGNDVYDGRLGHVQGTIFGGSGTDKIYGGTEANVIEGDGGRDSLYGLTGADTFVFKTLADSTVASAGRDFIYDFKHAQADRIDLHLIDADTTASASGNQAFHFIGDEAFGHHAGELQAKSYNSFTLVSGDVNGDAVADFAITVNKTAFVAGDFVL